MTTIYLRGCVKYADLTPAANVQIKINELDSAPGGSNDLIFNKQTNADGSFSGTSRNWQDREGVLRTLFGAVNIPDVLNLQFEVVDGNRSHNGPFIMMGNNSAPIILPFGPLKPVAKANRELVQIVYLMSDGYTDGQKALYSFIETGSAGLVDSFLGNDYKAIHRVTGTQATLANLKQKLIDAGSSNTTTAVDLVFCTHGQTGRVVFYEGAKAVNVVKTALLDIPANIRNKFRMLFSTACYGNTHAQMWLDSGFTCVSGSTAVYADSEASLAPFLHSWETERTFSECIAMANAADIGNAADNIAKAYYRSIGLNPDDIDSNRVVSGNGNLKIYSRPR